VILSKCVLLMKFRTPCLSRAKDSSAIASSYFFVSKFRPDSSATRSWSFPRQNSEVKATRSMSV